MRLDGADVGDAGVVDQDIDAAGGIGDALDGGLDGCGIGDVAAEGFGGARPAWPAAVMDFAVSAAAASSRSRAKTRAPCAAKVWAIARPMPEPAPVTMADFPSRRYMVRAW